MNEQFQIPRVLYDFTLCNQFGTVTMKYIGTKDYSAAFPQDTYSFNWVLTNAEKYLRFSVRFSFHFYDKRYTNITSSTLVLAFI